MTNKYELAKQHAEASRNDEAYSKVEERGTKENEQSRLFSGL